MEATISESRQSTDSLETDATESNSPIESNEATWWDVVPYFNFLPYFILYFYSFYYMHHNVLFLLLLVYVGAPLIDATIPIDKQNLEKRQIKSFEKDYKFLIPLYTYWVLDFFSYFWGIYQACYLTEYFDAIRFVIVSAHIGGVGLAIGHEQLHRRQLIHKICGTLVYSKALYSHFFIEHTKGHHKYVSTPEDPASAQIGESLYPFTVKSCIGSYKSVWNYEVNRLQKQKNPESPYSLNNRLISFNLAHLAYVSLIAIIFGLKGFMFVMAYAILVIFFQETINYIEHYGLRREKDENGIYESVGIKHSWNAPYRYTNYILFKLQRHSDHHANAYKPYQILNTYDDSPTLLGGYSLALVTSLCPPVYKRAYDPIVRAAMAEMKVTKEEEMSSQIISYTYLAVVFFALTSVIYLTS